MRSSAELIFVASKQMHFVVDTQLGDDAHAASYFKLEMGGEPIRPVFDVVRILGLRIDRKLTWEPHIEFAANNAHGAYVAIYLRYKNALYIKAEWVPRIMEAFVLSKMASMCAVWGRASVDALKPARLVYNNMTRYAQGGELSTGLHLTLSACC